MCKYYLLLYLHICFSLGIPETLSSEIKRNLSLEQDTSKKVTYKACLEGYKDDNCISTPICNPDCLSGTCAFLNNCTCNPGFFGTSCENKCQNKTFGVNCSKNCSCLMGDCNHVTGECTCSPGYTGHECSKILPKIIALVVGLHLLPILTAVLTTLFVLCRQRTISRGRYNTKKLTVLRGPSALLESIREVPLRESVVEATVADYFNLYQRRRHTQEVSVTD